MLDRDKAAYWAAAYKNGLIALETFLDRLEERCIGS